MKPTKQRILEDFIKSELRKRKMRKVKLMIGNFDMECFAFTSCGDIGLTQKWFENLDINLLKIFIRHEIDHIQLYRILYHKSRKLEKTFQRLLDQKFERTFFKAVGER
jgi:hypothetical protein